MADNLTVIRQTQKWLSTVVIAHGLCPFAKREFEGDSIHYAVIEADTLEAQLEQLILECAALDNQPDQETSLLIFPKALAEFDAYLDMIEFAAGLLKDRGYEGTYQLASFHPDYCFQGASPDDPANYTNRSPYPMIHILREASVEKALESHPDPENIPGRNIQLTRGLGLRAMKVLLAECYEG